MKILVLSSHTPSLFWFRMDMMRAFISAGNTVIAVGQGLEKDWADKFADEGVEYRQIPISRNGLNAFADIKTYFALKKLIAQTRPDKIFTYQAKSIVYGTMAAHSIDPKIEVYALVAGLGSIFRGDGLKNRIVRNILSFQYKAAFKFAKAVIFQNGDDRDDIINYGLVESAKTEIVHGSGVNISKFTQQPLPARKGILYIGRLIADKGVREFVAVAERIKVRHPDVRCMVVGPFDTNPSALTPNELQNYISRGVIEYFGEQSDVRPYIEQCSVYVLPSYHEGTPKTVLEAMAMGRPIVTSNAPGCRQSIEDGVNGFLVPVKNVDAIEKAVLRILNDEELAKKFSRESRRIAEDKYDVNKVNAEIMRIMKL